MEILSAIWHDTSFQFLLWTLYGVLLGRFVL